MVQNNRKLLIMNFTDDAIYHYVCEQILHANTMPINISVQLMSGIQSWPVYMNMRGLHVYFMVAFICLIKRLNFNNGIYRNCIIIIILKIVSNERY